MGSWFRCTAMRKCVVRDALDSVLRAVTEGGAGLRFDVQCRPHVPVRSAGLPRNEMSAKQIDVTCPCCSTRLTVDVLTRQILRRTTPEAAQETASGKDRWNSAQERVR